jgi:hypothetical protein
MVQSGIAYAAGQLLAVVAPRTVLVVDAPTDWSLAGPLWELALDDAPVDEILDVLIRRGIRTAPSFAIVRVENDAVRALVRGSVPVCFERVGEPVRLDATGATTWLEGLISSARRVLVGAVETNTTLPFLVSTGVVLVSGLALPCGPIDSTDRGVITPGITETGEPDADGGTEAASDPSYFARSGGPVPIGGGAYTPVGREPRVVDLTRTGGRSPSKAFAGAPDSRALTSSRNGAEGAGRSELNGHVPSVLEPPKIESGGRSYEYRPDPQPVAPAEPSALHSEPIDFTKVDADDPGELQDLDSGPYPSSTPEAPASDSNDYFSGSGNYSGLTDAPEAEPELSRTPDALNDPIEDEPDELPSFGSPSLNGVPAQPRALGGAPAAWPPAADSDSDGYEQAQSYSQPDSYPADDPYARPVSSIAPYEAPEEPADEPQGGSAMPAFLPPLSSTDSEPPALGELPLRVRGSSLRPEHRPAENGLNGSRQLSEPAPGRPEILPAPPVRSAPESRFRDLNAIHTGMTGTPVPPVASSPSAAIAPVNGAPKAGDLSASGNVVLPAFFRGARNARKPGDPEPAESAAEAPASTETESEAAAPSSWLEEPNPSAPAAWVAPVRRGFPAPEPPAPLPGSGFSGSGFNGGPPAMPSVLRPAFGGKVPPPIEDDLSHLDQQFDEPTESTPPPVHTPGSGLALTAGPETPREPPRLLGVWCDAGHVTSPDEAECRVCGLAVPPQAPILVARPPLGVLIFDNGDRVVLDRPVVLGRDPKQVASPDPETPVLHAVPSATGQVSRTHAEIRAEGWEVLLTDLDAMNGTALTLPGSAPIAIEPGVPTLITPGTRVDLGGESGFVFEVDA